MAVITIFSGMFCNEQAVIKALNNSTGYPLFNDEIVIDFASKLSGLSAKKIRQAFSSQTSVFNEFTHEKERSIAFLKLAVAELFQHQDFILSGYSGLLIPGNITHVLRVGLTAELSYRKQLAAQIHDISENESVSQITADDQDRSKWTKLLFDVSDPYDAQLYDKLVPVGQSDAAHIAKIIAKELTNKNIKATESSLKAVDDFVLAAKVETLLVEAGHKVGVEVHDRQITLIIDQQVLMLSRLENELKSIINGLPGVSAITTKIGPSVEESRVYRKHNLDLPSKVLLVDDEQEFVQTLSERLQMRDMGTVVAYDGSSALSLVENDDPEVMIVDLNMPGMDGMELLSRVKQIKPEIEIIILTGHGSEQDKKKCMELGAFAYMQKPADINVLSDTLKQAHEKLRSE